MLIREKRKFIMKKKIIAIMLVAAMAVSVTACGNSADSTADTSAETTAAETTAAETEAAAEETEAAADDAAEEDTASEEGSDELGDAVQEFANALDGTVWVGMDAEDFSCYALAFSGTEIVFAADDGSSIEGYWAVNPENIYIYTDEEMSSEPYDIAWTVDTENDTFVLNGTAVMAQTDAYSFDAAVEAVSQLALASQVAQYLNGTYWVTINDTEAEAVEISGEQFDVVTVDADGTANNITFKWGMDYNYLYCYDDDYNVMASLEWNMSDDGTELYLTSDGETNTYTQVSEEDAVDIMTYLINALSAE